MYYTIQIYEKKRKRYLAARAKRDDHNHSRKDTPSDSNDSNVQTIPGEGTACKLSPPSTPERPEECSSRVQPTDRLSKPNHRLSEPNYPSEQSENHFSRQADTARSPDGCGGCTYGSYVSYGDGERNQAAEEKIIAIALDDGTPRVMKMDNGTPSWPPKSKQTSTGQDSNGFSHPTVRYTASRLGGQMAAKEPARRERESADITSVGVETSGGEDVVDGTTTAKAIYARKLREQIASHRAGKRLEREKDRSASANNGPAWLEDATEGRERRRRSLKENYAEQLRNQIAERASARRACVSKSPTRSEKFIEHTSKNQEKTIASGNVQSKGYRGRGSQLPFDKSLAFCR